MAKAHVSPIVKISYSDLEKGELSDQIERGFGEDGLGLILITNVPNLTEKRAKLLRSTYNLGKLPEKVLDQYEHAPSYYSVGWSRGKEMLAKDTPDYAKGSYYGNPLFNQPTMNKRLVNEHAAFYAPNIWPEEIPELESQFLDVGRTIVEVGTKLARHCDIYCTSKAKYYPENELENMVSLGLTHKARLLHYYPCNENKMENVRADSWCGWHNDHGALTGLLIGQFYNEAGESVPNPEPQTAGLFIKTRAGEVVKVSVNDPKTTLAFQIGETAQIQSGGLLMATPHAVMGTNKPGYTRTTFAVFMEPNHIYKLEVPEGRSIQEATFADNLPENVPPLKNRWGEDKRTDTFNDFSERTFKAYYALKMGDKEDVSAYE